MDTVCYSLETVTDEPLTQTLTLVSHPQRETVMMNLSTEALAETVQAFCHLTERVADGLRTLDTRVGQRTQLVTGARQLQMNCSTDTHMRQ